MQRQGALRLPICPKNIGGQGTIGIEALAGCQIPWRALSNLPPGRLLIYGCGLNSPAVCQIFQEGVDGALRRGPAGDEADAGVVRVHSVVDLKLITLGL